jgi:hypothetical protein
MPSLFYPLGAPLCSVLLLAVIFPSSLRAETRAVRRGESLQAALNAARPGDVVLLEAGAEFVGNFFLPLKSGDAPIVVRSAVSHLLPVEGVRIQPSDAPLLARLRSPNTAAVLRTAAGTHHWELRYLEFAANQSGNGDIIQLGDGSAAQNTVAKLPHHLLLSHLYVHGDRLLGQKRGIALNAAHVTIRDSHIAECKGVGIDTQAIGSWNGPGPYVIENNYLEATGENVLFGGSDPAIPNLVADGITFRRNHVSRPMAWRDPILKTPEQAGATAEAGGTLSAGLYAYRVVARRPVGQGTIGRSKASLEASAVVAADGGAVRIIWQAVPDATEYRVYGRSPATQSGYWTVTTTSFVDTGGAPTAGAVPTSPGTLWSVKNLFELKNARNVLVQDNIFENNWKESQAGSAIVLTPRNENGACTWCVVEGVRFENNIVRHVGAGINLLGFDNLRPSRQTRDVTFRNNLFYDIDAAYGGNGWVLMIGDEPRDIVFDHNTISHSGGAVVYVYGGTVAAPRRVYGMQFTNNAARHNTYGINGQFFSFGNGILQGFFPGAVVGGNYLAGGSITRYPAGTRVSGSFEGQFVDAAAGDFRLRPDSQLRGTATDGGDIGADIGTVIDRLANVEAGRLNSLPLIAPANVRIVAR